MAVGSVKRKGSLFEGYWRDMNGRRMRRLTRSEMREVWRLWSRHKDIRDGRAP